MNTRVLLMVGSPRASRSTSEAMGAYLLERLRGKGCVIEKVYIYSSLGSEKSFAALLSALREADIAILVSPLYVDSLPAGVVKAMELIRADRKERVGQKRQRMLAVSNSGFPEAEHNTLSLAISKRFAVECGFEWAGGLALGGGEAIAGKTLKEAGGLAKNVRKSLDITADALARDEIIGEEAVTLMARPLMPRWLYLVVGNIGWRLKARRQGCKERLDSMPYEREMQES
jgi:multimeric flavodoxin WrbA